MYIRLCGINSTHPNGIKIQQPTGFGDYLFLRLKTPTRFFIKGQSIDAAADHILLYRKGSPQFYETIEAPAHIDDYIFFDAENEDEQAFLDQLPLKFDELLDLPDIRPFMNIHQLLFMEFINRGEFRKDSLTCLLKYFLIKLSESMNTDFSGYDRALLEQLNALRLALYRSPAKKWEIRDMANYVNLSPSYLQNVYKKTFHISCMADLINSRTNHAKQLLSTTHIPINEVAELCGYASNIYFARQFKHKVGMTPTEYRQRHM